MFENLFWITASILLAIAFVVTCVLGYGELKRQVALDKLRNPGKPDAGTIDLEFCAMNRREMDRKLYHARKLDKRVRKYRRPYYVGR